MPEPARKIGFDPTLMLDPGWMIHYGADDRSDAYIFAENHRRFSSLSPEAKLMLAVLEDAITTWIHRECSKKMRREADSVLNWLQWPHDDGPFSFVSICGSIFPSLEPRYLARKIVAMPARPNGKRGKRPQYRSVR